MSDKNFDLIVVSSAGFDGAGYPLPAQILVCEQAAKLWHDAPEGKKPLILANALGMPNRYQPVDLVLGGPVVQSRQTELLLKNLGVAPQDIVRGQFAIETIGEGMELYTLLAGPHPNVEWMKGFTGRDPIEWTDRAREFQQNLGGKELSIAVVGPQYQVDRSVVIDRHMVAMAGVAAQVETLPVTIPDNLFTRVNLVAPAEMQKYIQDRTAQYERDWKTAADADEFFGRLHTGQHGLLNDQKKPYAFVSSPEGIQIAQHDERTDLAKLSSLYRVILQPAISIRAEPNYPS